MRWRGRLVCLLIFYFAGFATAIYCLAPVPDEQAAFYGEKGFPQSAIKSDWFAKSANVALRKAVNFTADAAFRTIEQIKQKSAEKPDDSPAPQSAAIHR
jgi:hypothetical protein